MIFCHKNEKEITLGADSAQENWGSRAKVSNLIINAAQAAGRNGKIELAFEKTKKALTVEIHDNGPDVSPDQAETIFDPGFTTKTGGTGLGLLSVQAFVSSCHGKISMDRSHLGGAVFRLTIPVQEDDSAG